MSNSGQSAGPSRRDALKKMAVGAGAMTAFPILGQAGVTPAMAHAAAHLHGAQVAAAAAGVQPDPNWKALFFDPHQNESVIALTELIIPETETPGAKAALVNRFIDLMLNDEDADKQKSFIQGLAWLDGRSLKMHSKPFVELSAEQQTALLTPLADPGNKSPDDEPGVRFFQEIKDWTLYGYYTSRPGMVRELEYGGADYHEEFPGACTHPEHQT
jgi:glucoside 3-dehydrogenase (cytochrome c) hitch-hiker subunit